MSETIRKYKLNLNPLFKERFANFFKFVEVNKLRRLPGHSLGFTMPDQEYFEKTSELTDLPAALRTTEFLNLASREETLQQAKAYLDRLNDTLPTEKKLLYFSFRSRFLGTPDRRDVTGRLLVHVPAENLGNNTLAERWIQFGISPKGDTRERVKNVSVIAVVKKDEKIYTPYFKDHFRIYNKNGSIDLRSRYEESNFFVEACYMCHKMGVAPFFPEQGSVPQEELARVEEANKRIRKYGTADYGDLLDLKSFGPGMGQAMKIEKEKLAEISTHAEKIAKAMNCAGCHSAKALGELRFPIHETMAGKWVKDGKMPPGQNLDDQELKKLHDLLVEEFFRTAKDRPGTLKSWMLSTYDEESAQKCRTMLLERRLAP